MDRVIEELSHGWWVVSHEQKLWLPGGELPYGEVVNSNLVGQHTLHIGEWQSESVWMVRQGHRHDMGSLRQVLDKDPGLLQLAGRGIQLVEFYRSHKSCGYYGHPMYVSKNEWAMLYSHCRKRYYPQIAPCIVVAIRRDDSILLAQHTRHRNGVRTVLAGFVEVGETLEQAVAREVMEESDIKVKNLRHMTFQPWPLPQSPMTAFMADYADGDIVVDKKELLTTGQYRYDNLPLLPPPGTVARRLIEDMVAMRRAEFE